MIITSLALISSLVGITTVQCAILQSLLVLKKYKNFMSHVCMSDSLNCRNRPASFILNLCVRLLKLTDR